MTERDTPTFRQWLTSKDPALRWPVIAWLCWAVCVGILIGVSPL